MNNWGQTPGPIGYDLSNISKLADQRVGPGSLSGGEYHTRSSAPLIPRGATSDSGCVASGAAATMQLCAIFLIDIDHPESLTSAALYAERLKNYYRKLDRPSHQSMLNTAIFCLGNSGESDSHTTLIRGLTRNNSWDHIDSLILTENYREEETASLAVPVPSRGL